MPIVEPAGTELGARGLFSAINRMNVTVAGAHAILRVGARGAGLPGEAGTSSPRPV